MYQKMYQILRYVVFKIKKQAVLTGDSLKRKKKKKNVLKTQDLLKSSRS